MTRNPGSSGIFATVLGAFFLVEGAWGMASPVVFGVLSTNRLHAAIHLVLGILGLWVGMKGGARTYDILVGALLAVVGVLYFVPGVGPIVVSLLNVNTAVAVMNIVVGAIAAVAVASSPNPMPIGA